MAAIRRKHPLPPADIAPSRRPAPEPLRPLTGADGPPPGSLTLPLSEHRQLWLALHLEHPRTLDAIAALCHRYTPLVSPEPPDALLLEVRGSLRLFGGARVLIERLQADLHKRAIAARLALAPTPNAALWLARGQTSSGASSDRCITVRPESLNRHLASVPVVCLRWPEEQTRLLDDLGIRTVGELMRLPREGLARRLGRQWLLELDRALGRCPHPRRSFIPPQRYRARLDPETPLENTAQLEALLLMQMQHLQQFLCARQAAIAELTLQLHHRNRPPTRLTLRPATPCEQTERLGCLLHEHLLSLKLPAPVTAVRLRSGPLLPAAPQSDSWLRKTDPGAAANATALPRLVELLQARLGEQALCGIRPVPDHRPEKACKPVPPLSRERCPPRPPCLFHRPLWLREIPERLPEQTVRSLQVECGPERIESGWWDGADVRRDYYIVRDARGRRLWVYRELLGGCGWYLHGLFG